MKDAERRAAAEFKDDWNELTVLPIPRCRELTDKRVRHIARRLQERTRDEWQIVIRRIQASPFCQGHNDRGWVATIDWVISSPDVAVKVLEGKYDDRRKSPRVSFVAPIPWQCPHEPHCGSRGTCQRLQNIAAMKAGA